MTIIWFLVGFAIGIGAKFGLDEYSNYKQQQEKTFLDMNDILVKFKAMELNKKDKINIEVL